MDDGTRKLLDSVMQLPEKERLAVASRVWISCNMPFDLMDQLQAAISKRTLEEMENGKDPGVPVEDSIMKARSAIS